MGITMFVITVLVLCLLAGMVRCLDLLRKIREEAKIVGMSLCMLDSKLQTLESRLSGNSVDVAVGQATEGLCRDILTTLKTKTD